MSKTQCEKRTGKETPNDGEDEGERLEKKKQVIREVIGENMKRGRGDWKEILIRIIQGT